MSVSVNITPEQAQQMLDGVVPREVIPLIRSALRPPCPMRIGALIRDADGGIWVRTAAHMGDCNDWVRLDTDSGGVAYSPEQSPLTGGCSQLRRSYADIEVVEVLFEGVRS